MCENKFFNSLPLSLYRLFDLFTLYQGKDEDVAIGEKNWNVKFHLLALLPLSPLFC